MIIYLNLLKNPESISGVNVRRLPELVGRILLADELGPGVVLKVSDDVGLIIVDISYCAIFSFPYKCFTFSSKNLIYLPE